MAEEKYEEFIPIREVQVNLEDCSAGKHKWSFWFTSPAGLTRECRLCHKIDFHYKGRFDKFGFQIE